MSKGEGFWAGAWKRFRRSKLAVGALIYVALVSIAAAAAPWLARDGGVVAPFGPDAIDLPRRLQPPLP